MSILISFIINIAIINLHYLGCVNSLNIVANKDISDEKTAMYMKTYIEDFKCSPDIGVKSTKLTSTWIDLLYLSYVVDKPKTFDYILSKKPTITRELIGGIISDYIIYLAKNGVSISKKTPNTLKSLEFLETEQYKRYKEEKMTLFKKILDNGAKSDLFKYLLETLEYINDEKDLENLLNNGNKKELAQ